METCLEANVMTNSGSNDTWLTGRVNQTSGADYEKSQGQLEIQ